MLQFNESVRLNRLLLQIVIETVLYLSKQELAFQGHNESNDSINHANFRELFTLSWSSMEIQQHYTKIKSVFSGELRATQSELIECISDYIYDYVKNEIDNASFFTVQVDGTTDINQTSQCSVILRFVTSREEIQTHVAPAVSPSAIGNLLAAGLRSHVPVARLPLYTMTLPSTLVS